MNDLLSFECKFVVYYAGVRHESRIFRNSESRCCLVLFSSY